MSNTAKLLVTLVILVGVLFVASLTLVRSIVPDSSPEEETRRRGRQTQQEEGGRPRQGRNNRNDRG